MLALYSIIFIIHNKCVSKTLPEVINNVLFNAIKIAIDFLIKKFTTIYKNLTC